jgi:hypothetical protein
MALGLFLTSIGWSTVVNANANLSAEQFAIEGETVARELEEMIALASCMQPTNRQIMHEGVERWLKDLAKYQGSTVVEKQVAKVESTVVTMDKMPDCAIVAQPSPAPGTPETSGVDVRLGKDAGHAESGVFIGELSGHNAQDSAFATVVGHNAGYNMQASENAVAVGRSAAEDLREGQDVVAIGSSAGRQAVGSRASVLIGNSTGYAAKNIDYSVLLGYAAGRFVKNSSYGLFTGYAAGEYADLSDHSILAGAFAGYRANNSPRSLFIGRDAGMYADHAPGSIMIGLAAGRSAQGAVNPVFIGVGAGSVAARTTDVVLIGTGTQAQPGIENAVGIGRDANPRQSNTWHIPEPMNVGIGTATPTAQLHTTRGVRFEALKNGVLVADNEGNISASDELRTALIEIAKLKKELDELKSKLR